MNNGTKVKLTARQSEALRDVLYVTLSAFEADTEHVQLLQTIAWEVQHKVKVALVAHENQGTHMLGMTDSTALGLCQYFQWLSGFYKAGPYEATVMRMISDKVTESLTNKTQLKYARIGAGEL